MEYQSKYTLEPADVERARRHSVLSINQDGRYKSEEGAVYSEGFTKVDSRYEKIQRFAGRFKIEQRGIERVPEDERTDTSLVNVGTMVCPRGVPSTMEMLTVDAPQWLSANMVVSSFAIGALAVTVFHLGFVDSLLTILFINLLGITPVAFFSTFGPRFGLRQMILSRYYFGYHGVKVGQSPILRQEHEG